MHALVTAPIPSHPQNHGNRVRVYSICRELQARGYQVHYVYSGLEGLTEAQENAMRSTWEHVYILPRKRGQRKRSHWRHHLIDDWHPDEITKLTNRILNIWDIKICVANYVWLSAWLDHVPRSIPRYIDTHDVFGNRHKALKKDGLKPTWFYTTPREEAKALKRATTVIAIQDTEAKTFRALSDTPVTTLGFFDAPRFLEARTQNKTASMLKVGYIASDNPININALKALTEELMQVPSIRESCDFYLAGPICKVDLPDEGLFKRLGFVESQASFYEDMDLILNPNMGGTGLKIKSVEALSFGRALLATNDAMIGIPVEHPLHRCRDIKSLCQGLIHLARNPEDISHLEASGREVFQGYYQQQQNALDSLFPRLQDFTEKGVA